MRRLFYAYKKAAHTRALLLGMVIVNLESNQDPYPFRGKEIYNEGGFL